MRSDAKREHRIAMEIIVDANGPEEEAMGWYCYLEHTLCFPFTATCIADRAISPVYKGDEVDILGMAPERACEHEMFVETHWGRCNLVIPLAQVKPMRSTNVSRPNETWSRLLGCRLLSFLLDVANDGPRLRSAYP